MNHLIKLTSLIFLFTGLVFYSCKKENSCEGCINGNKPPVAKAGFDQVITLPMDSITLDGSASNDPDGVIKEWRWTKISGPLSFSIVLTNASKTSVKNLTKGVYQFELTVKDIVGLTGKDTIQITVNDPIHLNQPPIADAGPDQTIFLPSTILNGSASTDPDNDIASYQWSMVAGPSSVAIANASAVQTQVTNLVQGTYKFELKVTDAGGLFDRDTIIVIQQPVTQGENVYVVGSDGSGNSLLWRNGIAQSLPSNYVTDATSVFVDGNDVYAASMSSNASPLGCCDAVLWKNGVENRLGEGWASSVFVSGSDVYIVGSALWKNGQATGIGNNNGRGNSVFVSGIDVYVAGEEPVPGYSIAMLWKNGVSQNLGSGSANSVFVSGSDVYVAGRSGNVATLWKNGQATSLGTGSANSVFVSGVDVYVAGTIGNAATLWKNGQATSLGTGGANSVFVSGSDVYIAGYSGNTAILWKNGQATSLGTGSANSVFVK